MSDNQQNPKIQITLAVIALISALGVALITNWNNIVNENKSETEITLEKMNVEFNIYEKNQEYSPIEFVEVRFSFSGSPASRYTDSNGFVSIEIPQRREVEVILKKDGFKTKREILNLQVDQNKTFNMFLEKDQDKQEENGSSPESYFPLPPPDLDNLLAEEYTLTDKQIKVNTDSCSDIFYDNVVVASSEIESSEHEEYYKNVRLMEADGITYTYNLPLKELPRAEQIPLTPIFVKGRRLRVGIYLCGTGNFRYLAYVKPLKGMTKIEDN